MPRPGLRFSGSWLMSGRRGSRAEAAPAGGGGAAPPQAAGDHSYFYEDEVYRVNGRGQVAFGLVLDNCEGSSSDTDGEQLQRGDLRVVWHPSGRERVVSDRSVRIFRSCLSLGIRCDPGIEGVGADDAAILKKRPMKRSFSISLSCMDIFRE